jgi:hypothetical protein
MSSEGRSRRRELVEEAYKLQMKAGLMARRIHLCPSHLPIHLSCHLSASISPLTRGDLNVFFPHSY